MACGTMQEPVLVRAFRFMLSAHRIIRAKLTELQGVADMLVDSPADLNQSAERSLRVGRAGVEKDAVSDSRQGVNTFAN